MTSGWSAKGSNGNMADNIGTAYVQIEPSFEGVTPKIEQHFGGEGQNAGKSFGSGFGSVVGTVGKVMAGAAAAGAAAVTGVVKSAASAFADYEQLTGGITTLFEDLDEDVIANAQNAFKTAGLSANDYMETVMSFSASLNQSLMRTDGNIARSAELADQAIIDMSDNANKMGTSMESIQNAYQGFAKQNYTMLDNLKLGYGGTKTEMERLLADASKIAGVKFDISNYSDVIEAIHVIQQEMGITGTTSLEASDTITGSLSAVKASWENMMVAIATGDNNALQTQIDNMTATVGAFANNILPVVQQALKGVSELITRLAPEIAKALPDLIKQILPGLLEAGIQIIQSLAEGIIQAIPELMPAITDVILQLCDMLVQMLPELIQVGLQVILQLAMGIAQAIPELIPAIVDTVIAIVEYLIDNVDMLIDAAIAIIIALADGLITALPRLIEKAPEIIIKLVAALIRNAPKLLEASIELIAKLIEGIVNCWTKIFEVGKQVVDKVKEGFSSKIQEAREWGRDMIQNFIDGIMAKFEALKGTVKRCAQAVKDFLGFSEPEEGPLSNFHTYAPDMMKLYAQGITDNAGLVQNALTEATADMMTPSFDVNSVRTIQSTSSTIAQSGGENFGELTALLKDFITNFKQDIYLDTGALVGATAGAYNVALGQIATRGGRR